MKQQTESTQSISHLYKNSVMVKLITITILILVLLIPMSMIESIIDEREVLNNNTIEEVSSKWANRQCFNGPILTIPLKYEHKSGEKTITTTKYWNILPDQLNISGNINPENLRRGIYQVVVYNSELSVTGSFSIPQKNHKPNLTEIMFSEAFLTIGISDLRGVQNQVRVVWDSKDLSVEPGSNIPSIIKSGITVKLPDDEAFQSKSVDFKLDMNLQGSKNLSFIPIGKTTQVNVESSWTTPSFEGSFLPDSRDVSSNGFQASWNILELNRNFSQSWIGNDRVDELHNASFGVNLMLPLGDYQKSTRSAKYAIMTISLTFLIFFLVEVLGKGRIHPLQYAMVGLALCLFYVLLVSISEHSNFTFAFGISTLGITTMITLYSISVFKLKRYSLLLLFALIGIYSFLFVTLQLADYALLIGSLGLAIILASTMYSTRRVDWYGLSKS